MIRLNDQNLNLNAWAQNIIMSLRNGMYDLGRTFAVQRRHGGVVRSGPSIVLLPEINLKN